uniref:F-box protein 43 n=1 Tax=Neogobius melanostomus TaxID=47308 RepID=A0A8C6TX80_9GOBI
MQCTPEPRVFFNGDKDQACYDNCFDSGYSGLLFTPQSITRDGSLSLGEENPKENVQLPATPMDRTGFLSKDSRAAGWDETPKLYKKDTLLQYRLALSKSSFDIKPNASKSPHKYPSSVSGQWLSTSVDCLDTVIGTLATSTLSQDQDLLLAGRKRRLLYSQIKTSTLNDDKPNSEKLSSSDGRVSLSDTGFNENCSTVDKSSLDTPHTKSFPPVFLKKNLQSPVCNGTNSFCDSSMLLCTPSDLQTPTYTSSMCEDSGFSSLTLDKSQDSYVDHDGSFQDLLLSPSKGDGVTPNMLDKIHRPRLQRQKRLSTLKEGGSQSEDDPTDGNNQRQNILKDDEVFTVTATPHRVLSLKFGSTDGASSTKRDYVTPLRRSSAIGEDKTPLNSRSLNSDSTPLRNTPLNLSLTPALELVHAMCQQRAQTLNGQSPSLHDELRSVAALVKTPVTFRTTMPLAGLIGRKMGVGTVDILTELNKRNLKHILSRILGHLTPKCIYRCGRVCRSWKRIIQQDRRASFKRRSHLSELNNSLEQDVLSHVPEADTRAALLKRSALKSVQSQSRSFCTPNSGSRSLTPLQNSTLHSRSSSKREKFLEVAKTLFNDEYLKPCPRCQHPARCHSVKGEGVCSNADCGFQFCISCFCAFHGSKECNSLSVHRSKKDILIPGSARSKRNIKRL